MNETSLESISKTESRKPKVDKYIDAVNTKSQSRGARGRRGETIQQQGRVDKNGNTYTYLRGNLRCPQRLSERGTPSCYINNTPRPSRTSKLCRILNFHFPYYQLMFKHYTTYYSRTYFYYLCICRNKHLVLCMNLHYSSERWRWNM